MTTKQSITFDEFKRRVSAMLNDQRNLDPEDREEEWYYNFDWYKKSAVWCDTVEDWVKLHFADFTLEKHNLEVKKI